MAYRMLLDTSSLMYRAFYSVPPTVTAPDGRPVNAVFGYLGMTARLIGSRRPDAAVHVYDHDWRPAARVALYEGYKGNRPADPEGLPDQFELLREVLEGLGLPQAEAPGWEAEDAIGAICERAPGQDRFDIVTGDRDLIQLVRDPTVRVLYTLRGVTELRVLDEAGVLETYGVPASRYGEFAMLRGDPSDGLPGVRGVGEKTARALVESYPTIDAMLEDAERESPERRPLKGSPALRARLLDAAGYLATIREVVVIRAEVQAVEWAGEAPTDSSLKELGERHGLSGAVARVRAALRGARAGEES